MNKWPQISVAKTTDLERIIPFIKNSYNKAKTSEWRKNVDELQLSINGKLEW